MLMPFEWVVGDSSKDHTVTASTFYDVLATVRYTTLRGTTAESRMETLMRLAGARAGMPELELQAEIHDQCGVWIGRFDAVDRKSRSLFEYDGDQHLFSREQRKRDARKHQGARDAGWRIRVLYHEDLTRDLLAAGQSMLRFSGRTARRVPEGLARLLDETFGRDAESAIQIRPQPKLG